MDVPILKEFLTEYDRVMQEQLKKQGYDIVEGLKRAIGNNATDLKIDEAQISEYGNSLKEALEKIPMKERKEFIRKAANTIVNHRKRQFQNSWLAFADNEAKMSKILRALGSDVKAYYINNLLSSPATHQLNIESGFIQMALDPASKITGGILTKDAEALTEGFFQYAGYARSFLESLQLGLKALIKEQGTLHNINPHTDTVKGILGGSEKDLSRYGLLGDLARLPGRFLIAEDEFLTQMNYRALAYASALNTAKEQLGNKSTLKVVMERAENIFKSEYFAPNGQALDDRILHEAKKNVFTNDLLNKYEDDTWITKMGDWLHTNSNKNLFTKLILPFIRTPINITQTAVDYTPLGLVPGLGSGTTDLLRGGRGRAKTVGKSAVGSAIMLMFAGAYANDKFTGNVPVEESKRSALLYKDQKQWSELSIKLNNDDGTTTYYPVGRIEPFSTLAGISTQAFELLESAQTEEEQDKILDKAYIAIANNLSNKLYFKQAIEQLEILSVDSTRDVSLIEKIAGQYAAGFVPYSSFNRWAKNTFEGEKKEYNSWADRVSAVSPFESLEGVPREPKRNTFGEMERLPKKNLLESLLVIGDKVVVGNQPADIERARLAELGFAFPTVPKKLHGNEINLLDFRNPETKQSAYDRWREIISEMKLGGKTWRERVNWLVEKPYYQKAFDGINEDEDTKVLSKTKMIQKEYQKYKDIALKKLMREAQFVDGQGATLKDADLNYRRNRFSKKATTFSNLNNQLEGN
jgi:hypothetical protein